MLKNILSTGEYKINVNIALLVLRVAFGTFMLTHGVGKFNMLFSGSPITFPDPLGLGASASLTLAVFAEVLCSLFLILGIGTRLAAIPLIITMLVAGFIIHAQDPFKIKEMAFMYLTVYTVLLLTGAGKYSLDAVVIKKINHNP